MTVPVAGSASYRAPETSSGKKTPAPDVLLQNLSKHFGRLWALRQVSLAIAPGEFVALLGQNGAGKTTLLRILALLLRPSSGKILFDGVPARDGADQTKRCIGLVGHHSFLYDELTAAENLRLYARLYRLHPIEARVRFWLERMGLEARADELVRNLSRGMRQRTAIARALLHDPGLLLLDEPFTGLDAQSSQGLMAMLQDFRTQHRTVVISTHHLEEVLPLATQVVVLEQGETIYNALNRPESASEIRACLARTSRSFGSARA